MLGKIRLEDVCVYMAMIIGNENTGSDPRYISDIFVRVYHIDQDNTEVKLIHAPVDPRSRDRTCDHNLMSSTHT